MNSGLTRLRSVPGPTRHSQRVPPPPNTHTQHPSSAAAQTQTWPHPTPKNVNQTATPQNVFAPIHPGADEIVEPSCEHARWSLGGGAGQDGGTGQRRTEGRDTGQRDREGGVLMGLSRISTTKREPAPASHHRAHAWRRRGAVGAWLSEKPAGLLHRTSHCCTSHYPSTASQRVGRERGLGLEHGRRRGAGRGRARRRA